MVLIEEKRLNKLMDDSYNDTHTAFLEKRIMEKDKLIGDIINNPVSFFMGRMYNDEILDDLEEIIRIMRINNKKGETIETIENEK